MPIRSQAREQGIFDDADLQLLGRVFEKSAPESETDEEREARASRIIGYFMAGIDDEAELENLARQPLGR